MEQSIMKYLAATLLIMLADKDVAGFTKGLAK